MPVIYIQATCRCQKLRDVCIYLLLSAKLFSDLGQLIFCRFFERWPTTWNFSTLPSTSMSSAFAGRQWHDGRVDGPDQHNNIMDTGDCSKLYSPRMTSSNLITSFIHDSFSALRSARHFCASSTNFPTYFAQFPHAHLANARQPQWNVVLGLLQHSDIIFSCMSQNTFKGLEH